MSSCALLTAVIAFIGLYIAYRQWRTARDKLKFDLFDRRFEIYRAAQWLTLSVPSKDITKEAIEEFLVRTRESKWLLSLEVGAYLDELYEQAAALRALEREGAPLDDGEERNNHIRRRLEITEWFQKQRDIIDEKFAPYLKIETIHCKSWEDFWILVAEAVCRAFGKIYRGRKERTLESR